MEYYGDRFAVRHRLHPDARVELTPRLPLMHAPLRRGPLFRLRRWRCPMPRWSAERSPWPTLEALRHTGLVPHLERLDSPRYLNMQHLAEHKKEALRQAA